MKKTTVAAIQTSFTDELERDVARVAELVEEAAALGAQVVLPPELFQGHYFCRTESEEYFARAFPAAEHPAVEAMQEVARRLGIVIPTSFFERDGPHYYNSLAVVDADGSVMGTYRKSHIPDGPGYEEKFYFRPGNDGFKTWDVFGTRIGVGICWDQWYPEAARVMALNGAEMLLYPTAIGSEPKDPEMDTSRLWRRAMIGHAVSNCMPVIAANRIGQENECGGDGQHFYGHSFISDEWGDLIEQYGAEETGALVATLDLTAAAKHRASWGFFRDRRPQLYGRICEDV